MQQHPWQNVVLSLLIVGGLSFPGGAQDAATPAATSRSSTSRGAGGFEQKLDHTLGLTPEQRDAVRGLLAQQREQFRSLHNEMEPKYAAVQEHTDSQIRTLLNQEQQKKFDQLVAQQKEERSHRRSRSSAS